MFQNALTDAFLVIAGYFITGHGDLLTVMDTPCESIFSRVSRCHHLNHPAEFCKG
jgi:hypothetical protein